MAMPARSSKIRFHRPAFAGLIACGWVLLVGCSPSSTTPSDTTPAPATSSATGTVTVSVAWPEGEPEEMAVPIEDPTTVEQVMRSEALAAWNPQLKGSGSTAFLTGLGDLTTAAGEGWTFTVDGEWAERGIGQTEVTPGAKIRWSYGTFESAAAGESES